MNVKNTRVYLSHFNPDKYEKACHGDKLEELFYQTEILYKCLLLSIIGFSYDGIIKIILEYISHHSLYSPYQIFKNHSNIL